MGGGGQNHSYTFHILSDNLSQTTQDKFQSLAKALNNIYPCEIFTHFVSENAFKNYPTLHNSHATYLRLKLASILPKHLNICLYLDVDILVLSDLRELFNTNLKGNLLAAVGDFNTDKTLPHKIGNMPPYSFSKNNLYYNSGVMLINLQKWRKMDMESKALNFLSTYAVHYHDQDTINAIAENKILKLDPKWNLAAFYATALQRNLSINFNKGEYCLPYTQETFHKATENPAIVHYFGNIIAKPWESVYSKIHTHLNSYLPFYHSSYYKWWEIALQVPAFNTELVALKLQIEQSDLKHYSNSLANTLKERDTFFLQKIQMLEANIQLLLTKT